jgi:heme oxygenase
MSIGKASTYSERSLPLEISAATRSHHSSLNRLIVSRLPLCLPPHTLTPRLYTVGVSVFGTIYRTFEEEWSRILQNGAMETERTRDILRRLYIPELLRRDCLDRDLTMLLTRRDTFAPPREVEGACDVLQRHQITIRSTIQDRPLTLLAYAWVMYMALFNGGRWIRDQLVAGGPEFWHTSDPGANSTEGYANADSCLSFWQFEGGDDGLGIKNDFKRRFDIVAAQLTASERTDVVEEAVQIFKMCREMAELLDSKSEPRQVEETKKRDGFAVVNLAFGVWGLLWMFLALAFRSDSVGLSQHKINVEEIMDIEPDSDGAERSCQAELVGCEARQRRY